MSSFGDLIQIDSSKTALIRPGRHASAKCGYCHQNDTFKEYQCLANNLTVNQYQRLIDRGFRRSGTVLYKPDLLRTCCKLYTIRTNADKFEPNKEHRQCLNRFTRFLESGSTNGSIAQKTKGKNNSKHFLSSISNILSHDNFRIVLEPAEFSQEKYQLFKKYQIAVHKDKEDDNTPKQFKSFLCDHPFKQNIDDCKNKLAKMTKLLRDPDFYNNNTAHDVNEPPYFGPAHQLYYYNDILIAIGVIDLLPHAISSVYLIRHPDYDQLTLGKFSALIELATSRLFCYKYYYMGYYIDNCTKMMYKKNFEPCYLLDPVELIFKSFKNYKKYLDSKTNDLVILDDHNYNTIDDNNLYRKELEYETNLANRSDGNDIYNVTGIYNKYLVETYKNNSEKYVEEINKLYDISLKSQDEEDEEDSFTSFIPGKLSLRSIISYIQSGKMSKEQIHKKVVWSIGSVEDEAFPTIVQVIPWGVIENASLETTVMKSLVEFSRNAGISMFEDTLFIL